MAAEYYVAPGGNDSLPGSIEQPWRTIQKAADTLAPGDRVFVRAGTYDERVEVNVSGSADGGYVNFENYPGETPIVTSSVQPSPNTDTALFLIADRSYVVVKGLELANYKATKPANNQKRVPMGVLIRGASSHIEIRDCKIHDIWNHFADGNAFGLAVYGDTPTPITNVIIDRCEIHDCRLGNSESLAINGNVTDFEVTNNLVHDNTNIGIVAIGYEKTCCGGKSDPLLDRARDGVIRGNTVWNCTSTANPAYRNTPGAGGIYVDGGTRILIEQNISYGNDIGLEIASEHFGKASDYVVARNNVIYRNKVGGIFMGGYDIKRGRSENNTVRNNTLWQNDTLNDGNGEILFQHRVKNNVVTHNIIAAGAQNLMLINPRKSNIGNLLDYNLWFAPAGATNPQWRWKGKRKTGFAAWQVVSGSETHSFFNDPLFVNEDPAQLDLHLQAGSPAVDAGDPALVLEAGETDIDGGSRITGTRIDIGADER